MRKRTVVLLCFLLLGCNAAKEPLARAGKADAEGNLAEAAKAYGEVCEKAKDSPLCAIARAKADRLKVKEAYKALDEGQFGKAKEMFTAAAAAEDGATKRAATAGLEEPALKAGLVWDEAAAASDKASVRAKMEELAAGNSTVAPRAREWLAKNGPPGLLVEVKAACKPDGVSSCMELGKKMAELYLGSPEEAEAAKLVEGEYARLAPLLRQAENLLIQRSEVYNKKAKYELCLGDRREHEDGSSVVCQEELSLTEKDINFPVQVIAQALEKKLGEVHDPGYVKAFNDRYKRIEESGEYDGEAWPKPGEKAK